MRLAVLFHGENDAIFELLERFLEFRRGFVSLVNFPLQTENSLAISSTSAAHGQWSQIRGTMTAASTLPGIGKMIAETKNPGKNYIDANLSSICGSDS
jgi:hypothetical protein